ncbi:uncharacterized protein LOC128270377 [Anopheles cruzii]|uniref:uncharacterized protein LOC128270377 n=1 Tax=Anopheles cruzii TaxID=68878 RepID=UPI0022EC7E6A|nr:uncharacterized protein LOC128270377 [Anopheles cruzii]
MNPNEVVYISNIPKQTSLAELQSFLRSSGTVICGAFMRENRNDCRTKIAFVLFENEIQAAEACNLDQTLFHSHRLSVLLSNDDRKFCAGFTIAIQNTSSDTSEEDLFEACCRYGNVEAVQIPTNFYAFVGFTERSAAHAAQRKLNNSILKKQKVSVKVLDEDMRVRLEDLDSFKSPRVYNELLRAKQKYIASHSQKNERPVQGFNSKPAESGRMETSMDHDLQNLQRHAHDAEWNSFEQNDGDYRDGGDDDWSPSDCEIVDPSAEGDDGSLDYGCDNQEYDDTAVVYRKELKFGRPRSTPEHDFMVKFENVPREVYEEDMAIYCQQYGAIVSIEKGSCSSRYHKYYLITYAEEQSQLEAIKYFRQQVELSGVVCTIFAMIPGEALQPLRSRCVLINYLSFHIRYEDIAEAFANIGDVVHVERRIYNYGPTIAHFRQTISLDEACGVNNIAGSPIIVGPVNKKMIKQFTTQAPKFKKALAKQFKGMPKSDQLAAIEAKEAEERRENIVIRTAHNPYYHNPDPSKYSHEVALYNCPKSVTFFELKNYFLRAANVLAMRHEPSQFAPSTWKVYVSFGNYLDAFRAVRLRGKISGEFVYKHIAAETPRLDSAEVVMVTISAEESFTVARVGSRLAKYGAINFAEQIGKNKFIVIYRDFKAAQKSWASKTIDGYPTEICSTHKFIAQSGTSTFALLSNVLAESEPSASSSAAGEPKSQSPEKSTKAEIRTVPDHKVTGQEKKQPIEGLTITVRQQQDTSAEPPKASSSSASITPKQEDVPEPETFSCPDDDLRSVIEEKRESNAKMNELEEMERIIKEKEEDIKRRLKRLEKDEASVTVAMLLPSAGRSRSPKDDRARGSSITSRHSGSTRRSRSPVTKSDGSTGHQRSAPVQNISSITPIYAGASNVAGATNPERGTSPSDLLAHERFVQIRSEKIAISQELDSLRQRFSSRKSSRVDALESRLAVLEREQRDLQIQLEIKQRFRLPHDVSYFVGTSFDRTPSPHSKQPRASFSRSRSPSRSPHRAIARRLSRSQSRSPSRSSYRAIARRLSRSRSRSPSRSPHRAIARRLSRSQSRSASRSSHRAIVRRRTRSRSRTPRGRLQPNRRQQSRSQSPEASKRRRTRTKSRSPSPRRPDSMAREMYSIGNFNHAHGKHSVYVGNISRQVTRGELESIFDRYGKIDTIDFERFARYREVYIDYLAREDAFRALEMNNTKIGGRRLRIAFNSEKPSNREGYTLYLIPKHPVSELTIYQTYESYGDIDFIWYPDGSIFCTVSFRRSEAATDALEVRELIDGSKVNAKPFRDRKW